MTRSLNQQLFFVTGGWLWLSPGLPRGHPGGGLQHQLLRCARSVHDNNVKITIFYFLILRPTGGPEAGRVVWPRPAPALAALVPADARGAAHLSEHVQPAPGSQELGQEKLLRLLGAHLLPRTIRGEHPGKPDYFPSPLIKLFFNETDLWSAINW